MLPSTTRGTSVRLVPTPHHGFVAGSHDVGDGQTAGLDAADLSYRERHILGPWNPTSPAYVHLRPTRRVWRCGSRSVPSDPIAGHRSACLDDGAVAGTTCRFATAVVAGRTQQPGDISRRTVRTNPPSLLQLSYKDDRAAPSRLADAAGARSCAGRVGHRELGQRSFTADAVVHTCLAS